MTGMKKSTSAKPVTRTRKKIELPSLTHWIKVEDNHIPTNIWLLIEATDEDGDTYLTLGYYSKTKVWVSAGSIAIEEQGPVRAYSIVTGRDTNKAIPIML